MGSGFFAGFFVGAFPAFLPSRNRQMTSLVNWDGKWGWWGSLETPALFPEELFMLKVRYIFTPARSNRMGTRLHLRLVYPVRIVVPVSHGMGTIQGQRANQRKKDIHKPATLEPSFGWSALRLIRHFTSKIEKRCKGIIGPDRGRKFYAVNGRFSEGDYDSHTT